MKNKTIIIGAGPAGMACAMELHKAKKKFVLIEKNKQVGGLSKTLLFKEGEEIFRTDIGPHRFFSKNPYLYTFIEELLQEKWILVPRKTRQFIQGKWYDYPVNPMQALKNIGLIKASAMLLSYGKGITKYKIKKQKIENFEEYIIAHFGKKLGEFNMLNYTEKIWGIPCSDIHPDWAKQRIQGLNIRSTIKNMLSKKKKDLPKSLVDLFYYPQYGTGLIYETIAEKIKQENDLKLETYPLKIIHKENKVIQIELESDGKKEVILPEILVTSIPITELIKILDPSPQEKVLQAMKELKWRAQVYLFITFNKERITEDNWIYFPEKDIPFGRISEMKNFSKDMSPEGKTSLLIEFFVNENDPLWNASKEELFNITMKTFERIHFPVNKKDVRQYYTFKQKNVYPIYDIKYKENIQIIKSFLNTFTNLHYIGRPGRFQYTNQDHSLEMGILTAKNILSERKQYDLDLIGTENEYFEKGYIKQK